MRLDGGSSFQNTPEIFKGGREMQSIGKIRNAGLQLIRRWIEPKWRHIDEMIKKRLLKRFSSYKECAAFLKSELILSKFAMLVSSEWGDASQSYYSKSRFILDGKATGVTRCAGREYSQILPRVTDAVHNALKLL